MNATTNPGETSLEPFTEEQHALLFAYLSKAVCQEVGNERGEKAIRTAVCVYGEERGQRMAARAKANGHALDTINFFAYSEFKTSPGAMSQSLAARGRDIEILNTKCPWYTAWKESSLMKWGCLYCREIDDAVLRGFNPELRLGVEGTRSNGDQSCDFIFRDAKLGILEKFRLVFRKTIRPGAKAVEGWDFHAGHLFASLERTLEGELGESGRMAVDTALDVFTEHYGKAAKERVLAYRDVFA